ncbi:hypothetical protein RJ55_04962 [Drechmeria coniospora]|nr:hypothetical protein RJ55_04962 [Drechmeria coniospora]
MDVLTSIEMKPRREGPAPPTVPRRPTPSPVPLASYKPLPGKMGESHNVSGSWPAIGSPCNLDFGRRELVRPLPTLPGIFWGTPAQAMDASLAIAGPAAKESAANLL